MSSTEQKQPAKRSGHRYSSIEELLASSDISTEVREHYASMKRDREVATRLREMRLQAGLSLAKMSELLGTTEDEVEELESSPSEALTLDILQKYAEHTRTGIEVRVGRPSNHVESIKLSVFEIQKHLQALVALAHKEEELNDSIQSFFGEAFFNFLRILSECQRDLPEVKEVESRIHVLNDLEEQKISNETNPNQLSFL